MKTSRRDAMKLIRSITSRPEPEQFPEVDDDAAFKAEKKLKHYVPTPEQIAAECKLIRAERGEEVAAIHKFLTTEDEPTELVSDDDSFMGSE